MSSHSPPPHSHPPASHPTPCHHPSSPVSPSHPRPPHSSPHSPPSHSQPCGYKPPLGNDCSATVTPIRSPTPALALMLDASTIRCAQPWSYLRWPMLVMHWIALREAAPIKRCCPPMARSFYS